MELVPLVSSLGFNQHLHLGHILVSNSLILCLLNHLVLNVNIIIPESMSIYLSYSFFQLKDLDFFQITVVQDSISSKVYVSINLLSFLKELDSFDGLMNFYLSEHMSLLFIFFVNFRKTASHFLG